MRKPSRRRLLACLGIAGLVLGAGVTFAWNRTPVLSIVNVGPSGPHGVYLYRNPRGTIRRGDYVLMVNPPNYPIPWLMKRAVGVPGDHFCWRPELGTHVLNGRSMSPPAPAAVARGLLPWIGCRHVEAGELVTYGSSDDSYDARYMGIVKEGRGSGQVVGAYVRLLTFSE